MEKEFVPYEESYQLKPLGFAEPCFAYYGEINGGEIELFFKRNFDTEARYVLAPTFSQAFRWFRKKYHIIGVIDFYNDGDIWEDTMYRVTISEFEHFKTHDTFVQYEYQTYEEAELACLRKLIDIVKNK